MKVTLNDTAGGYNLAEINANFQKIEDELNNNILYRDNPVGEPNAMSNDLDMNNKRVYNLPEPLSPSEAARLQDIQDVVSGITSANLISFTPTDDISATNVQAAIAEVNSEGDAATALVQSNLSTHITELADGATAGKGTSLIGWLRAATSSVATTLKSFLGWQEINAFEFMSTAQIADFQSGAKTLDLAVPLQAWINACQTTGLVGRLPPGNGRVGTTLTLGANATIRGHGIRSGLSGWGVDVFSINADHVCIEDLGLFGYSGAGAPDPRTSNAITSNGILAAKNNYAKIKNLYLQGWNRGVDLHYMDSSTIEDLITVNCNYGIRYFGQSVNNKVVNSNIVVNAGIAAIHCQKNGGDQGEGLMVTNCLLASGQNAFLSDGFLAVGFYNCVCDLFTEHAFDMNSVVGFTFNGPWVYSAKRCFNFQALGSSLDVDANVNVGLATTTGASQAVFVVGANNKGIVLSGGTYNLTSASGSVPLVFSGSNISIGPVIVRNATSNADIQINGIDIRISQEALFPKGIQTVVSQVRSVTSGATTTLGFPSGFANECIIVNGNTNCTTFNDPAAWVNKFVTLRFTGTPTWTDGGNMKLNGNFVATADDILTLYSDGTSWYEVSRSAN